MAKLKAAIYTRFSTDKQQSTESQIDECKMYAAKNNIDIVDVYSDEATTGTNTNRKGFNNLIYDAQSGLFNAVIIYDISRGSRDVADWFNFRKLMMSLNVKILSATEKLGDISDPNDFLVELLTVGIGQHTVLQSRQKSIAGKQHRARQGLFNGGTPPLGYDVINGKYVINDAESKAVKLIFSLYASGKSYDNIIDELINKGYRGKLGQHIGKNTLYSVLKNDKYIGIYSWGRRNNRSLGKWVGREGKDPIEMDSIIPPIVDHKTWDEVQRRMENNKRNAVNKAKSEYLLSGLIECEKCGSAYVGHTRTNTKGCKTRYYICGNKYRTHTCDAQNLNADSVETDVVQQLKSWLKNKGFEEEVDAMIAAYNNASSDRSKEIQELKDVNFKIANCIHAITTGLDYPELRDTLAALQVRKNDLEDIVGSKPEEIKINREALLEQLQADADNFDSLDIKELIRTYVQKIYTHDDNLTVIIGVHTTGSSGAEHVLCILKFKYKGATYNRKK